MNATPGDGWGGEKKEVTGRRIPGVAEAGLFRTFLDNVNTWAAVMTMRRQDAVPKAAKHRRTPKRRRAN